jgi:SAM-dependent methyltransferase
VTAGTTSLAHQSARAIVAARSSRWIFVAALSLSSFLMFTLELLAGRVVLPVFGGAPGVWATALCFFTGLLFCGYAYAHVLVTRLSGRRAATVHLVVAVALVVATVLGPTTATHLRDPNMPEALNVLLALLVLSGPPVFLLASTTPLLSSWFAGGARDAWWLYAASNAASLLALIAYPFVVEPSLPLSGQWVAVRVGLVVFLGVLAAIALSRRADAASVAVAQAAEPAKTALGWRRVARWLFLAFVPAGLLTATTTFLTTDLVSAPFIWIGPLAIYLASFVVAFSERGRRVLPMLDRLVPAAATLLWLPYVAPVGWPVVPLVVIVLGSFAVLATAVHGRLAMSRPESEHLTHFYLLLSLAGVIATAIVGVAAPMLLPDIYEYPALLVLALIALALGARQSVIEVARTPLRAARDLGARLITFGAVGAVLIHFMGNADAGVTALLVLGGMVVAFAVTLRVLVPTTVAAMVASLIVLTATPGSTALFIGRSFFGVSKVVDFEGQHRLYSGTTLHGVQFTDARSTEPTSYYAAESPLSDVFADLRARTTGADIGVVGLGAGVVAAYTEAADRLTYFEIDPLVVQLASDPQYFSYLTDSPAQIDIVLGDGRLTLADEPAASFDVLVLDAFSSDSVPPHLLTAEAIASYLRVLRPDGVLAFNMSNRYYDLAPAVAATARSLGFEARIRAFEPSVEMVTDHAATASLWLVIAPDGFGMPGWSVVDQPGPVLTDDYPDLLRVLRLR